MRHASSSFFLAASLLLVSPAGSAQNHRSIESAPLACLAKEDWDSIRAIHEVAQHAGRPTETGYSAYNPGQQWWTAFDGRGFVTTPTSGGWSWGLALQSYGFAGSERELAKPRCMNAEGQRIWTDWDGQLEEWYINDRRGLEHGYTLQERPHDSGSEQYGPLRFSLAVWGSLRPSVSQRGRGVSFLDAQNNTIVTYSKLIVFDADGQELEATWTHEGDGLLLEIQEREARYPVTIDPIAQQAYLKASNTDPGDRFGRSIAVSGDTVVVGAPEEDSSASGVNGDQTNNGAIRSGAAYVFVRSGTSWTQQAYLKASNSQFNDEFGHSVAVCGDTVVIGARQEDSASTGVNGDQTSNSANDSGAAYVFVRSGTTWSQQAYLKASNTGSPDGFGQAVSISADTILVTAESEGSDATGVDGDEANNGAFDSGAAYVFVRSGTTWSQQAYLKSSNTNSEDHFGFSADVSGDTAVVGAFGEDSDAIGLDGDQSSNGASSSGAAYVFVRSGTTWSQQAYLKASNTETFDSFGSSVSVSGDTIVVGANGESSNATGVNGDQANNLSSISGAAYVFVRSGTTWTQQAYLKASNAGTQDQFGFSVSVSGNRIAVGARFEDTGGSNSGAAYVFSRSGTSWSEETFLKASNVGGNDLFAFSVAISGDTVAVGANGEDGSSTGVNGDQANNNATNSGTAYVFAMPIAGVSLCIGNGGDQMGCTNCPCLNNTVSGTIGGCLNSAGDGALLEGTGERSVTLPPSDTTDLRFGVSRAPATAFCILTSGDGVAPGNMANPCFGLSSGVQAAQYDGLRCAIMNTRRHGGRSADANGEVGVTNSPWGGEGGPPVGIAQAGSGFAAGQVRYFQVIYRDDVFAVCMRGLNTSQAVEVTFTP